MANSGSNTSASPPPSLSPPHASFHCRSSITQSLANPPSLSLALPSVLIRVSCSNSSLFCITIAPNTPLDGKWSRGNNSWRPLSSAGIRKGSLIARLRLWTVHRSKGGDSADPLWRGDRAAKWREKGPWAWKVQLEWHIYHKPICLVTG